MKNNNQNNTLKLTFNLQRIFYSTLNEIKAK